MKYHHYRSFLWEKEEAHYGGRQAHAVSGGPEQGEVSRPSGLSQSLEANKYIMVGTAAA